MFKRLLTQHEVYQHCIIEIPKEEERNNDRKPIGKKWPKLPQKKS